MQRRTAMGWILAVVVPALTAHAGATEPRFFVAGTGRLALRSMHSGEDVAVTYRLPDGRYDAAALAKLRRVLRSRDRSEGPLEPRFVELLGWLYDAAGGAKPLRVQSSYRSPAYNEAIRRRGARAASGSLHTEGMAADVLLDRNLLEPLWQRLRQLGCCGAGYYPGGGFLHVDVGTPRFWDEHTSRVDENLSAGNARLFARTEFDRYAVGDDIHVRLHALTVPPVRIARAVAMETAGSPLEIMAPVADVDGCVEVDAETVLTVPASVAVARTALVLAVCRPSGQTPATVRTNPLVVAP